jgi:hypothetical protein
MAATRLEKMTEEKLRLLVRIRDTQSVLERTLSEIAIIVKKLHATIKAHNAHNQSYITLLKNYRALMEAQFSIYSAQHSHTTLTSALTSLCLSFGLRLLTITPNSSIATYLRSCITRAIESYIELHPKPPVIDLPPPSESRDPDPTILDPLALLKSIARKPKRSKRSRRDPANFKPISSSITMVDLFPRRPRPPDEYAPSELIDLLSLAARTGGIGPDFYGVYHSLMRSSLEKLLRTIGTEIRERERELAGKLALLNRTAHKLLIKGKCPMAVQTDTIQRVGIGTMTIAPTPEPPRQKKKG